MQRNSKYFENPEQFNPDRFLKKDLQKPTLFTYIPFGDKQHGCTSGSIGMTLNLHLFLNIFIFFLLKSFIFLISSLISVFSRSKNDYEDYSNSNN